MERDAPAFYRHQQRGTTLVWGLTVLAAVVGVIVYRATGRFAGAALAVAVLAVTNVVFSSLTVTVSPSAVALGFGPGLFRRTFGVEDIAGARAVRNSWWYGWGIHLTPHGWLYNVGGLDAVELALKDGRKARIGTDEPRRLVTAIEQALAGRRG